jgi:hypothetical protein
LGDDDGCVAVEYIRNFLLRRHFFIDEDRHLYWLPWNNVRFTAEDIPRRDDDGFESEVTRHVYIGVIDKRLTRSLADSHVKK